MTSTPTETIDPNEPVAMRHPALGDVVDVPQYAVDGYEDRGYELVTADNDTAEAEPVDTDSVLMRHSDLGDEVLVPWFAVEGREQAGWERVDGITEPGPGHPLSQPAALPAPTGATSTRATTSGTAKTPAPDGDQSAATPAD